MVMLKGKPTNTCRQCNIDYLREYRVKNRDRLIEFDRKRHAENPEIKRRMAREWARENRERHNENTRRWAAQNRDKAQKSSREWEHRTGYSTIRNNRRRIRRLNAGGDFTPTEWSNLKKQHDYRCLNCGRQEPDVELTADHVIPVSLGGHSDITNIQPLCRSCNARKATKIIDFRNVKNGSTKPTIPTGSAGKNTDFTSQVKAA